MGNWPLWWGGHLGWPAGLVRSRDPKCVSQYCSFVKCWGFLVLDPLLQMEMISFFISRVPDLL